MPWLSCSFLDIQHLPAGDGEWVRLEFGNDGYPQHGSVSIEDDGELIFPDEAKPQHFLVESLCLLGIVCRNKRYYFLCAQHEAS